MSTTTFKKSKTSKAGLYAPRNLNKRSKEKAGQPLASSSLSEYFLQQDGQSFTTCQVDDCGKKFSTRVENHEKLIEHLKKFHSIDFVPKVSFSYII